MLHLVPTALTEKKLVLETCLQLLQYLKDDFHYKTTPRKFFVPDLKNTCGQMAHYPLFIINIFQNSYIGKNAAEILKPRT